MSKVSVILLTYNQELHIRECLDAWFRQSDQDFQLVISDDASTDNTPSIIQSLVRKAPNTIQVKLLKNAKNLGIHENLRQAISASSYEWLLLAAGDDYPSDRRVELSKQILRTASKKIEIYNAAVYDVNANGEVLGIKMPSELASYTVEKWFRHRPYFTCSNMYAKSFFYRLNIFESVAYEDQILIFRGILSKTVATVNTPMDFHRRGGVSQSGKKSSIIQYKKKWRDLKESILRAAWELNQIEREISVVSLTDVERRGFKEYALHVRCSLAIAGEKHPVRAFGVWLRNLFVRNSGLRLRFLMYKTLSCDYDGYQ
jgi:glycosyltransferase involved in cell wall biosynthesis